MKPGVIPVVDASKRPYATIDGKAVEVAGAKADFGKAETPKTGAPAGPVKIAAPSQPATAKTGTTPQNGERKSVSPPSRPMASAAPPSALAPWLPSLISGAAGAVLALLGLGSLGLLGGDPNSGSLAARLAALERSPATPVADATKQLAAAETRLAALEGTARDLAQQNAGLTAEAKALADRLAAQGPGATAASDRIQKLEQQLADLAAAAASDPQRGRIPALAQITTKLGDLDTQLTTRTASLKAEVSQDIEKRLATAAETAEAARARLAQRTQSLETTLKSVGDDTTALRTTVDGLKSDLDTRFSATAKPADVAAAIGPVTSKVDGLAKDLASVVRSEQDRNATAGNVLLSLELANLKRAIDRGGSYASELAAVKKAGAGKLNLAVLETAQSSGLPSLATLSKEFSSLAYTMLDAEADPAEGSVLDRMVASAKSVVRVRKVTHNADDKGTEATIGRMELALKDGRLGDVLEQSKQLAAKPLVAVAPWLKKVEARYTIETALADLDQSLKNALAGSADLQKGSK